MGTFLSPVKTTKIFCSFYFARPILPLERGMLNVFVLAQQAMQRVTALVLRCRSLTVRAQKSYVWQGHATTVAAGKSVIGDTHLDLKLPLKIAEKLGVWVSAIFGQFILERISVLVPTISQLFTLNITGKPASTLTVTLSIGTPVCVNLIVARDFYKLQ